VATDSETNEVAVVLGSRDARFLVADVAVSLVSRSSVMCSQRVCIASLVLATCLSAQFLDLATDHGGAQAWFSMGRPGEIQHRRIWRIGDGGGEVYAERPQVQPDIGFYGVPSNSWLASNYYRLTRPQSAGPVLAFVAERDCYGRGCISQSRTEFVVHRGNATLFQTEGLGSISRNGRYAISYRTIILGPVGPAVYEGPTVTDLDTRLRYSVETRAG
jgi:hypothetical protein